MSESPVALITGSGRDRIGRAVALGLAEQGYRIAVHCHSSRDAAEETVQEIETKGVTAKVFQADVGQEAEVDAMMQSVHSAFGRIDAVVLTASIWPTKTLEETTASDVLHSFQVNALGSFLCARAAGLMMAKQQTGGCILLFGDWAIQRPYPDHAAYFIAKGAIPTMTRMLAVELAQRNPNIRVNCIHPGPVMFPPGMTEEEQQASINSTLLKTANRPEAVVQTVQFLLNNSMITGACLPVDGGRTIWATET